jgi:hypothetical protein
VGARKLHEPSDKKLVKNAKSSSEITFSSSRIAAAAGFLDEDLLWITDSSTRI